LKRVISTDFGSYSRKFKSNPNLRIIFKSSNYIVVVLEYNGSLIFGCFWVLMV
jgi:hypothetical protein